MEYNKDTLSEYLLFSSPIRYSEKITLHPIKMEQILKFQTYIDSMTFRKDSKIPVKEIIKMTYFDFLFYCTQHPELENEYKIRNLQYYYYFAGHMLGLACKDQEVLMERDFACFYINGEEIDAQKFDDLRQIIFIQNDVDFDINEFMHQETEEALRKAQEFENKKNKEKASIEDYIDSVVVGLRTTEDYVKNLSMRKFWRELKRINKYDDYYTIKTAEYSGTKFKESIPHWTCSIDVEDKYSNLKTDEQELRNKIG